MLRKLLAIMLALAPLAGCLGSPATEGVDAGATDDAAAPTVLGPVTEEIEGEVGLSVATPARTVNSQPPTASGSYLAIINHVANATGYVIEVEWDATTPASETLSVWVREAGVGNLDPNDPAAIATASGEPLAMVTSASPLRLTVPGSDFPAEGEYEILVRAAAEPVGVAANQPFAMHLTSFVGIPFDDAYTAHDGMGH